MASQSRQDSDWLMESLWKEPWRHDFFQALRQIETQSPDRPRLGRSTVLAEDPARFGQFISLAFAPNTIDLPPGEANTMRKLLVRFMGLSGSHGPLPLWMTEEACYQRKGLPEGSAQGELRDSASTGSMAAFYDVFHHRMICLFFRAWAIARKTVDFDRQTDRTFAKWLASFFGGLPESLDSVSHIRTEERLPFTGFLACPTRPVSGLEAILKATFGQAKVTSLTGSWLEIPPDLRCSLGKKLEVGTLGQNCIVGSKIWDRRLTLSIAIGPLPYHIYEKFLPSRPRAGADPLAAGPLHRRLHDWVADYTRNEFFWQATILLKKEDVPATRLGNSGCLGQTAWLSSKPHLIDRGDLVLKGGGLRPSQNR